MKKVNKNKVVLMYFPDHVAMTQFMPEEMLIYKEHSDIRIVIRNDKGEMHAVKIQVEPIASVTLTPFSFKFERKGETND
jgi:hypothetical protein